MNPRLFGCCTSLVDDILVIGTPSISKKGSLHTYKLSDRNVDEIGEPLLAYDGHSDDGFGISCKLFSNSQTELLLIVGAHRKTDMCVSTGAAYIYKSSDFGKKWEYVDILSPVTKTHKSFFGCSVDINKTTAIVGSYGDNTEGWKVGSVSIFNKNDQLKKWNCVKTLVPNSFSVDTYQPSINNSCYYFGFCVALSEQFIVVGAPSERKSGSTYLFHTKDTWDSNNIVSHKINGVNNFGFSIDIFNDQIVVGSPGQDGVPGKTFIYNISSFFDASIGFSPTSNHHNNCETLIAKSKSSKALFGRDVSIHNDLLLVSGFGKNESEFVGSAFLYIRNNESETDSEPVACLRDSEASQLFGHSVCLNDQFVVIGDPSANNVHIYNVNNIMNGNSQRWANSTHIIKAPQEYLLEIN